MSGRHDGPGLVPGLALEMGSLTARATLQDPDVRVEPDPDGPTTLTIEEGGVRLDLDFPDVDAVERFERRVRRAVRSAPSSS